MVSFSILWTLAIAMLVFGIMGIVTSIMAQIQGEVRTDQSKGFSNYSATFTNNNTFYSPSGQGEDTNYLLTVTKMYNDSAHTCTYSSDRWAVGNGKVKIYANNSGSNNECPQNMTAGNTYYFDGTYAPIWYKVTNKTEHGIWNVGKQYPLMGTILVFGSIIAIVVAVFLGAIAFRKGRI